MLSALVTRFPIILCGFVLAILAVMHLDVSADEPDNLHALQPLLVDRENGELGIFTGQTITYDEFGTRVKAFAYLTSPGYVAAMRPDGWVGSVDSMYFSSKNCRGPAYLLAVNHADVSKSYLPGIVFSFGNPPTLYAIKRNSEAQQVELESQAVAKPDGIECLNSSSKRQAYRLRKNDPIKTGVPNVNYFGVRIEIKSGFQDIDGNKGKTPFINQSGEAATEPFNLYQQLDSCSPGCESDMVSNGICEPECNNRACGYDANDCSAIEIETAIQKEEAQCAPLCELDDLGDGFCDRACNNEACNFDNGDCPFN